MTNMKKYGIISGLGANAGVDVLQRLNAMVAEKSLENKKAHISQDQDAYITDEDFPEVFYYQLPFKGVSESGELSDDDSCIRLEDNLADAVKYFSYIGVDALLFACNTYNDVITGSLAKTINYISLYKAFSDITTKLDGKTLILASKENISKIKESHKDLNELILPSSHLQDSLDQHIKNIISKGRITDKDKAIAVNNLIDIIEKIINEEGDFSNILLACTEISVSYHELDHFFKRFKNRLKISVYDTIQYALESMTKEENI